LQLKLSALNIVKLSIVLSSITYNYKCATTSTGSTGRCSGFCVVEIYRTEIQKHRIGTHLLTSTGTIIVHELAESLTAQGRVKLEDYEYRKR
jgi:hypothetical protein